MSTQEILAIISSIGTILTIFTGLIITYSKLVKQVKKAKEEQIIKIDEKINGLDDRLENIKNKLDDNQEVQDRRERHRLRESIVMFGDRVRSRNHNKPIKESAFNIIFANYSEYKKLGGNGYIEEEMDYIREVYRTLFNKNPSKGETEQ